MSEKTVKVLLVATEMGFQDYFRNIFPAYLHNFASRLALLFGIEDVVLFNIQELNLYVLVKEGEHVQLEADIDLLVFDLRPGTIPEVLAVCERLPESLRQKTIGFGDRRLLDLFTESRGVWTRPIFSTSTQITPRQNALVLAKIFYGEYVELKEV